MRIDSSVIGMESARRFTSSSQRTVGFSLQAKTQIGSLNTSLSDAGSTGGESSVFKDIFNVKSEESPGSRELYARENAGNVVANRNITDSQEQKSIEQVKSECIQYLVYLLYGTKSAKSQFKEMLEEMKSKTNLQPVARPVTYTQTTMNVTATSYYEEKEDTAFKTQGTVRTADGREINFNLEMTMSRSFAEYYEATHTENVIQMVDPLVINLDSDIASLSDQKFEFDLDSDGIKDKISMLAGGSGYLALDKNKDGKINDGSELFGTESGDGFKDLARFDIDGNGWIDEGDEIFDKLLIWSKNENGDDELYTLKEAGVGAICLQKASTDFSLNSLKDNQVNGAIRSTGIFLYENGNVGTIQHIDVAK